MRWAVLCVVTALKTKIVPVWLHCCPWALCRANGPDVMYLMFVSDNRPLGLRLLNLSVQRQICQQGLEYQIKFNSITAIIVLRMAIHFNPLQVLKTLLVRNQTANAFVENRRLPVQKKTIKSDDTYFDCGYDQGYCGQVLCTALNHGVVTVVGNDSFPSFTL